MIQNWLKLKCKVNEETVLFKKNLLLDQYIIDILLFK